VLVRPPPLDLNTILSFFCGGGSPGDPLVVADAAALAEAVAEAAAAPRPLLLLLPLLLAPPPPASAFFLPGVLNLEAEAAAAVALVCGAALAAAFLGVGPCPPFSQEVKNFLSSWSKALESLVTLAYRGLLGPL